MLNDIESSDSDSGSLPDLTAQWKSESSDISKGDIVWAKFKKLYWPALVRVVYPKRKKVCVWYCDEPGKAFKLPLKNVCVFHDTEMRAKVKQDAINAGCLKEHEGLTSHAERFIKRKLRGEQDDPLKFFDQTYPFLLVEELLKTNPNADVADIKIPPLYISHENDQSFRKTLSTRNASDNSELESTDSEDVANEKPIVTDFFPKIHAQLQEKHPDASKEFVDRILECILSGKADKYLQNIRSKSINSEHHNIFEQSTKHRKGSISKISYTGPIEDDDKLRKLIFYLLPLYEKMNNAGRSRRYAAIKCKQAITVHNTYNNQSAGAQYVASVWLPESIIFAISIVKSVSLNKAKKIFKEKSEWKTKALESIIANLDANSSNKDVIGCTTISSDSDDSKIILC